MPDGVTTADSDQQLNALTSVASGGDDGVPLLNTVNAMTGESLAAPRPLAQQLATAAPSPVPLSNPMLLQSAAYNPAIFETNAPEHIERQQVPPPVIPATLHEQTYVAAPAIWGKRQRQAAGLKIIITQVSGVPAVDIQPYYDDEGLN